MSDVFYNREGRRYELPIEGSDDLALAFYRDDANGHRVLTHTEVPFEHSGQCIASKLARGVFYDARATGTKLILKCPFMARWFAKHPDYADVVAG